MTCTNKYIMVNIVEYTQLSKISYIVSNARITCVQYLEYLKVTDVNITLHGGLHDQLILLEVETQNCLSEYYVNSNQLSVEEEETIEVEANGMVNKQMAVLYRLNCFPEN